MILSDIVKENLAKFPTTPSLRIARWINEKNPQYGVETIRSSIRRYRGSIGGDHRRDLADTRFVDQQYELPPPSKYDSSELIIKEKNVLILCDFQIPFHDNNAISAALSWAKKRKVDAIILDGDVLDCYALSVFAKDPRERNIKDEVEDGKDLLYTLKKEFGVPIYWKFGNHEERFDHYIYRHAEQLGFLKEFTLEKVMEFEKYNCKVIKDKRIIKIGHLNVIHGHEFGMGFIAPVNPARTFFLRAKAPTIGGDKHFTSEHSGKTINGKLITCWSIGCLCDLKPRYRPINEWNHGFAYVTNEEGTFRVMNMRIEDGQVY